MNRKTTILLSAITLITAKCWAQPVITGIGSLPLNAKSIGYIIPGTITHGSTGANQVWDYSTIPYNPASFYLKNVDFAGLSPSIQSAYPSGNLANEYYIGASLAATLVFQLESTDLLYLGVNTTPFASPDTQLVFPHSYLETKAGFTYDSYGTLSTPFGTFNNVVRLRETTGSNYKYDYWQFSPYYRIILEYKADTTSGAISGQTFYDLELPTGINNVSKTRDRQTVHPNPSSGVFHIDMENTKEATLKVFNILGETVVQKQYMKELDLTDYPKLIYFL
jgi:hypothetical protein